MAIEDQIKDETLQYDINREAAKISALSSGKIDKYEYFTGEETLPSNQQQIIEQAKFTYSPLVKAFEKQTKTIEESGEKQIKAINDSTIKKYIPENILNDEAKRELDKISEREKNVDREKLVYKTNLRTCDFQNFQTIRAFARDIYNGEISLEDANEDQEKLLDEIIYFHKKTKPKNGRKKQEKEDVIKNLRNFYNGRKKVINAFDSKIFPIKTKGTGYLESKPSSFKILTPNQMFKRLPIALVQIKANNNSESLLNEIRQIAYSLYRSREIKKVYKNIIKSIKV